MADSILPLVDALTTDIDALSSALTPLSAHPLASSASKLPLLDKAKLYVLATYAIESTLFSAVRLHGGDPKTHPVFAELARVKAYFGKIAAAENSGTSASGNGGGGGGKAERRIDQRAAGRFIKHGLAGNERYDRQRAETREREVVGAKRKLEMMGSTIGTHTRFEGSAKRMRAQEEGERESVKVVRATDADMEDEEDEDAEEESTMKGFRNGKEEKRSGEQAQMSKEEAKALRKKAKRERRRLRES